MKVIVVGAGIGGLGAAVSLLQAGHEVEVYERSSFMNEVGAAIHVQPNASRVLKSWGCNLESMGPVPCESIDSFEASDLTIISKTAIKRELQALSGISDPWILVHRVDLHNALRELAAKDYNGRTAKIHLNTKVQSVNAATGEVFFEDGSRVRGDLIVGADGLHSRTVEAVSHEGREKITTGRDVFRFMVPMEKVNANPVTKKLFEKVGLQSTLRFHAPGKRVIIYPCRSSNLLNIVAVCAAKKPQTTESETSWLNPGTVDDLVARFDDYAPEIQDLFKLAEDLKCWSLVTRLPVKTFVKHRLALLGDAAHPMLPHHGQGSAQALEDAAALGALFPATTSASEIPELLKVYDEARYSHAVTISFLSRVGEVHCDEVLGDLKVFVPDAVIPDNAWVYAWTSFPAKEVRRLLAVRARKRLTGVIHHKPFLPPDAVAPYQALSA
ncbi:FAD/NAD(P)-binding domain-containing protein [Xylariaceae sp. FL0255]|nr:FAD/NAD(P)-binding domain-containing protein [Xylariaceae sp. FL0255]